MHTEKKVKASGLDNGLFSPQGSVLILFWHGMPQPVLYCMYLVDRSIFRDAFLHAGDQGDQE